MNAYAPLPRKRWPGAHPALGAFLGFGALVLLTPYALAYGLTGFGAALFLAGLLAGGVARGGARLGFGAGARAAGSFMLLLLISWTVLLLNDQGYLNLSANPDVAEFMPYVALMEDLWFRVSAVQEPVLAAIRGLVGTDQFVDLLLRVGLPAIPGALGGALAGAVVGRPDPQPLPMAVQHPSPPSPGFAAPSGNPGPTDPGYLCPWCGLRVLPHMAQCWNCGGPLQLPPPPPD